MHVLFYLGEVLDTAKAAVKPSSPPSGRLVWLLVLTSDVGQLIHTQTLSMYRVVNYCHVWGNVL